MTLSTIGSDHGSDFPWCRGDIALAIEYAIEEENMGTGYSVAYGEVFVSRNDMYGVFDRYAILLHEGLHETDGEFESRQPVMGAGDQLIAKVCAADFTRSSVLYEVTRCEGLLGKATTRHIAFLPSEVVLAESLDDLF